MSDTPKEPSADDRKAAFAAWLKSVQPAKPTRVTIVNRVAPWRHEFVEAVAAGYSWPQLAKEVASKPEIGLKIGGDHLRKAVLDAFVAAKEKAPAGLRKARYHDRANRAKPAAKSLPAKP